LAVITPHDAAAVVAVTVVAVAAVIVAVTTIMAAVMAIVTVPRATAGTRPMVETGTTPRAAIMVALATWTLSIGSCRHSKTGNDEACSGEHA